MPVNYYHSAISLGNGGIISCGNCSVGQLGTGDKIDRSRFIQIRCPTNLISVECGNTSHTVGVDDNGSLWTCGSNSDGQLGLGEDTSPVLTFTQILGTSNFYKASAGHDFTLALDKDGVVWGFGQNDDGQLGLGDNTKRTIPTRINFAIPVAMISTGNLHSLLLDQNGIVWSFGKNKFCQLGQKDSQSRNIPCKVPDLRDIVQISSGHYHNLLVSASGKVYGFGSNSYGQLGIKKSTTSYVKSAQKIRLKKISKVCCGGHFSIAVGFDGHVWVFGDNFFSQLGLDDTKCRYVPTLNMRLFGMDLYPGAAHLFAISPDGVVYSCGFNDMGQTGNESQKLSVVPDVKIARITSLIKNAQSCADFDNLHHEH